MAKLTMVTYLSHVDQGALYDLHQKFSGETIRAKQRRATERGYLSYETGELTAKGRARMRRTGPPEEPSSWTEVFDQDYWWRTYDGDGLLWITVKDMSVTHKANALAWLERNADSVVANLIALLDKSAWSMACYSPGGEMAADALDQTMDETMNREGELRAIHKAGKSSQWIRKTEIYRRFASDVAAGRGR